MNAINKAILTPYRAYYSVANMATAHADVVFANNQLSGGNKKNRVIVTATNEIVFLNNVIYKPNAAVAYGGVIFDPLEFDASVVTTASQTLTVPVFWGATDTSIGASSGRFYGLQILETVASGLRNKGIIYVDANGDLKYTNRLDNPSSTAHLTATLRGMRLDSSPMIYANLT